MRTRHKFKAKPVKLDGQHFASKLEFAYYNHLELLKKAGVLLFFLRQVPFHLPGGVKCVVDYLEFYVDGEIHITDVKGFETSEFIMKKKMVEALYPVEIKVIKRNDFKHV
jgi:hypothetical protein